jgi:hypothetical protein
MHEGTLVRPYGAIPAACCKGLQQSTGNNLKGNDINTHSNTPMAQWVGLLINDFVGFLGVPILCIGGMVWA